jgi:hypothetical protein
VQTPCYQPPLATWKTVRRVFKLLGFGHLAERRQPPPRRSSERRPHQKG